MQYLKVQYARTDVLAKNTETYTKESKSSSNSFQSILNSLQSQSNSPKVDSKEISVPKEKDNESSLNSSVSKEQKKDDGKKEIEPVKVKKENEPKSVGEEPVQLENEENQVYMMIDLDSSESDVAQTLKNLDFEESSGNIEFLTEAQVDLEAVEMNPDGVELENLDAEMAMLNAEKEIPEEYVKENVAQMAQGTDENETFVPHDQLKTVAEPKVSKVENERIESKEQVPADRKVFTVFDERTVAAQEEKKTTVEVKEVKSIQDNQNAQASILTDNARANILSTNDQSASATGSTFQQMLSQQIQQNAPEFAKAGTIILKDQNSGSINMILKPESLGNVKISLQLSDKTISGHIVVQSKEAMEAFKENLDLLRHSFQENGFENAQLSLSLADSSSENPFAQNQNGNDGQFIAGRVYKEYGQSEEDNSPSSDSSQYSYSSEYQIDVVA